MSRSFQNGLLVGSALFSVFILSPALIPAAFAENTLPEVGVEAPVWSASLPFYTSILPQSYAPASSYTLGSDGGEYLTSIAGVSGSRMGGHGIDPVIHGQQQTQLNIINDGAYIHGGCPNRMDPPSSYSPAELYDSITVLKGYQSVKYGAGGTGGTVLFERNPLPFTSESFDYKANAGAAFQSNGHARDVSADVGAGNDTAQMRGIWSHFSMGNYQDGAGNDVRSAATSESFALLPVWMPTPDTTVKVGVELTRMDDVLYAGAGMDSPYSNGLTERFSVDHRMYGDVLKGLSFKAYKSDVDHVMDNFSLRTNTGTKMKTLSESATFGGTILGDLSLAGVPLSVGVDLENNDRWAKRYSGPAAASDATIAQSYMWPDVRIRQTGAFAEATPELSSGVRLKVGARYDRVNARADGADTVFGAVSANTLYLNHYGITAEDKTENNFGGLIRLEYDLSSGMTAFGGLSRSVRTADATERYMAANSGVATSRWVGNPDLSPEKHNQLDAGLTFGGGAWSNTVSGYYDRVNDYIFRDLARGQDGIVATSNETIYRNINATLVGFEYEASYQITPSWMLGGSATYTYGQNRTDDDALSQIPPLEGRLTVDYTRDDLWSFGGAFNFAMKQTRIDDDTAQRDVQKTPGYGTLDLYAKAHLAPFEVQFGVTNLFDKNYARHLNRSNAVDPTEIQVNEPGRSLGLRVNARF